MIDSLIADTLLFIQQSFTPSTHWLAKKSEIDLRVERKPEKPQIPTQQKIPIPLLKAPIQPALKTSPKEEQQEELPKASSPTPQRSPTLEIESLSLAVKKLFPSFSTSRDIQKPPMIDPEFKRVCLSKVVLFSFREGKESDLFLKNLSQAITSYFTTASVIDIKKWELAHYDFSLFFKETQAKLIIAPASFYQKTLLSPFLKEDPSSSECFLGSSKLLILNPFENYFNNALRKKELWNTLCTILKNSPSMPASS